MLRDAIVSIISLVIGIFGKAGVDIILGRIKKREKDEILAIRVLQQVVKDLQAELKELKAEVNTVNDAKEAYEKSEQECRAIQKAQQFTLDNQEAKMSCQQREINRLHVELNLMKKTITS